MVVDPVSEQRIRFAPGTADPAADRWDGVEQRQQLRDVVAVAAGQQDGEWGSMPVGDQVVFGAG
jgi:hypothetical protein